MGEGQRGDQMIGVWGVWVWFRTRQDTDYTLDQHGPREHLVLRLPLLILSFLQLVLVHNPESELPLQIIHPLIDQIHMDEEIHQVF